MMTTASILISWQENSWNTNLVSVFPQIVKVLEKVIGFKKDVYVVHFATFFLLKDVKNIKYYRDHTELFELTKILHIIHT